MSADPPTSDDQVPEDAITIVGSKRDEGLGSDAELSPAVPDVVPTSYPRDLEQWISIGEDRRIWVRPVVPQDVARLAYAFAHADIETIRRRFFTAAPPTDRAHISYLANVDYTSRLALVAMDEDGNSVGIGRFEATEPPDAEVAIVVAPQWRRLGVGSALLEALEAPARDRGVSRFIALYMPENTAVERLLVSIGYEGRRMVDGIAQLSKRLQDAEPDPPLDDAG